MNTEIISTTLKIAACEKDVIPEYIARQMPREQVNILYLPKEDWLILNKDNRFYEKYKQMLCTYLDFTDREKKQVCEYAREKGLEFFDFVNRALRIRRKHRLKGIA